LFTALVLGEYSVGFDVARLLGLEVVTVHEKEFPDDELYVRILEPDKVKSKNTIIFSTLYPRQERALLKTLLAVDAAKRAGTHEVIAVIPYLAYARQDKLFLPGEPISANLIIELLESTGVSRLVTVDVHSLRVLESLTGRALNVMVSDLLVERALNYLVDPLIVAPDKGAHERACYAARTHGLKCDYLIKQRNRVTGEVSYTPREISVSNRDIVLVDDIISTGGTVAEATRILIAQGARRVIVAATHGLLVGDAIKKLEEAGVYRVLLANTLNVKHAHPLVEYVDISPRLADELKKFLGL